MAGSAMRFIRMDGSMQVSLKRRQSQRIQSLIGQIVTDFDNLPLKDVDKPKVGIVGEILVKFHPGANNDLVEYLESEGCEAVVPDFADFMLYCGYNSVVKYEELSGTYKSMVGGNLLIRYIEHYRKEMKLRLKTVRGLRLLRPLNIWLTRLQRCSLFVIKQGRAGF